MAALPASYGISLAFCLRRHPAVPRSSKRCQRRVTTSLHSVFRLAAIWLATPLKYFLSAVEAMTTDFQSAVRVAGDILRIRGTVLPATLDDSRLVLKQGGKEIVGQHLIVTTKILNRQPDLSLTPNAKLNPDAQKQSSKPT